MLLAHARGPAAAAAAAAAAALQKSGSTGELLLTSKI